MVMGVLNEAFDVLVLKFGVQKRIYCNVGVPNTAMRSLPQRTEHSLGVPQLPGGAWGPRAARSPEDQLSPLHAVGNLSP